MNTSCFRELIAKRRSIYNLDKLPADDFEKITPIITDCLRQCPSAFNAQPGRIVLLYNENSGQLWDIVRQAVKPLTPPERWTQTSAKIDSFAAGSGTILFFNDAAVTAKLQKDFPLYADKFPLWAEQSAGMLQYMVWTALAEAGVGASLQHYNPLIDDAVRQRWQIPKNWELLAQMPFGSVKTPAGEKDFLPIEGRLKIFV